MFDLFFSWFSSLILVCVRCLLCNCFLLSHGCRLLRHKVARLESMIQDAQHTYESTIRQHLQRIQKETLDVDDKRFPDLYANVRRWQDQLEPVLKEFDSRPEFDIYVYSMKMLSKMSEDELKTMLLPFAALVEGQPRWEVCRRFLTTLLLTNQGNTDILFGNEMERLNNFKVRRVTGVPWQS